MGKLNVTLLRYLSKEDFRLLAAVETGMRNHELVPASMIGSIAKLKSVGIHKRLKELAQHRLVQFEKGKTYDGYRLTNLGYDFLALRALTSRDAVSSVGNQLGVGKESDIYLAQGAEGEQIVLKFHRLGRTSFRKLREKRDYHKGRGKTSWIYLSRLAAVKEFAFMKALKEREFPVPSPLDFSRHCVAMQLIDGFPLHQVHEVGDVEGLYNQLIGLLVRLAQHGLIHGDFNEFNVMLCSETESAVLIDFPQMMSTSHPNAEFYFNRDLACIQEFFRKRFGFEHPDEDHVPDFEDIVVEEHVDHRVAATGYVKDLEDLLAAQETDSDEDSADEGKVNEENLNPENEPNTEIGGLACHVTDWLEKSGDVENLCIGEAANSGSDSEDTEEEVVGSTNCSSVRKFPQCGSGTIITESTIAPEEIRSRLRKEAEKKSDFARQQQIRKKAERAKTKGKRNNNKSVIKEYAGWDF